VLLTGINVDMQKCHENSESCSMMSPDSTEMLLMLIQLALAGENTNGDRSTVFPRARQEEKPWAVLVGEVWGENFSDTYLDLDGSGQR